MDHNRRIGLLRRRTTRAGLHGLLVTHLPDVRYLCGFTGSSAALAVTRRAVHLFTDGRYTTQAAEEVHAAKVQIVASSPATNAIAWLAAQIFDNLVGRKSNVRQNFESTEAINRSKLGPFRNRDGWGFDRSLTRSNESLIPAQNQRWRRA